MTESNLVERGLKLRESVLGSEYVNQAMVTRDEQEQELQELITAIGWGSIWARESLDRKTKSAITVAMLIALDRPHELRIHLRGALNNGWGAHDLRDMIIHAIPYCGIPAVIDSWRTAKEVLEDHHG